MAFHYGDGVVEHTAGEGSARLAGEHGGLGVFAGEDGERSQMVEVAVGEDDEVEGGILANYSGDSLLENQTVQTTPILIAAISVPPIIFLSIACSLLYRKRNQTTSVKKHHAINNAAKSLQTQQNADSISQLLRELQSSFEFNSAHSEEIESLIQRCDVMQYGGKKDQQIAQDASSLMEVLR